MPSVTKKLCGVSLAVTTLTDAYVVPAATATVISSIAVCNRAGTATTFRLSHAVGGAADAPGQYFFYDAPIAANATVMITAGICLAATDILRAYVGGGSVTVTAWGEEKT